MNNPDPKYLKNEQYKDASKLSARARLHADFNRNPQGWFHWMFELYQLPPNARILELGAGAGWLWMANAARIPPGWEITLSDFSGGMLDEQRKNLARVPHTFNHEEIDIQSIPYPDGTFDAVIANNMLYHVPDRVRAIAEMRRVLKPSGTLFTATNGENHLREVHQMIREFGLQPNEWRTGFVSVRGYTLENASEQLRAQFDHVGVQHYEDEIAISDPEPIVDYILTFPITLSDERIAALHRFVQEAITRHGGTLHITKNMGVLIARSG
jgi:SAM-dependent methyltransferase